MTFALLSAFTLVTSVAVGAETFAIDPEKSVIGFKIKNKPPNAREYQDVPGSFEKFSGNVVFDKEDPSKSSVVIEVDTASVNTENEKRDDHLRNQDFFKVKEFPKMTFKSTKVTKVDDGNYKVEGEFTLLDKTKKLTVIFEPTTDNGGKTSFQIKRSDYGMTYRVPDTADEVNVTLEVVGRKK